jgi:V/A-type H+-transporting ATPase subunit C
MEVSLSGVEAIYDYLETTVYSDAIEAIKESPTAFDRWCDDRIIELIKPQKYNSFTISPLLAFVLAKEMEIKSVRIILSGKLNELADESVREC